MVLLAIIVRTTVQKYPIDSPQLYSAFMNPFGLATKGSSLRLRAVEIFDFHTCVITEWLSFERHRTSVRFFSHNCPRDRSRKPGIRIGNHLRGRSHVLASCNAVQIKCSQRIALFSWKCACVQTGRYSNVSTRFSSVLFSVHDSDRYLATESTAKGSGLRLRAIEIFISISLITEWLCFERCRASVWFLSLNCPRNR